jgi:DNA-binding GntR family transcriptional regulator
MSDSRRRIKASVAQQIRDAILAGDFLPNERLVEADLAERYHANRANVRIALAVLEQEGLVDREANRGARVRLVSGEEALEIAEARMALEARVAYRAAQNATEKDCSILKRILTDMRELHHAGDLVAFSDLNGALHQEVQRIAANQTIIRLLSDLKSRTVRLQFRAILLPGRADKSLAEHDAVVEAVMKRDPDAAERAMRAHMEGVVAALKQAIAAYKRGLY